MPPNLTQASQSINRVALNSSVLSMILQIVIMLVKKDPIAPALYAVILTVSSAIVYINMLVWIGTIAQGSQVM